MLRRFARWYGAATDDFLIGGLWIAILAVTMAAWMLVDYGDPARAAVAAAGALLLALPRTVRRLVRRPASGFLLSMVLTALATGTIFFGMFWELGGALLGAAHGAIIGLTMARLDSGPARIGGQLRTKRGDRALRRAALRPPTVDPSPIVVETRVLAVVLRHVMAALMLGVWVAIVLYDELGGIETSAARCSPWGAFPPSCTSSVTASASG